MLAIGSHSWFICLKFEVQLKDSSIEYQDTRWGINSISSFCKLKGRNRL